MNVKYIVIESAIEPTVKYTAQHTVWVGVVAPCIAKEGKTTIRYEVHSMAYYRAHCRALERLRKAHTRAHTQCVRTHILGETSIAYYRERTVEPIARVMKRF